MQHATHWADTLTSQAWLSQYFIAAILAISDAERPGIPNSAYKIKGHR